MYRIERLDETWLDEILALEQVCFSENDRWKKSDWIELLADERAVYFALLDGQQPIGNIFLYDWINEEDYVKIMTLGVHPDYRRQGLAKRLLLHAKERLQKRGINRFCGETRASNTTMQKTFAACGYRLNRIEEGYYHDPEEAAYKYVLEV